VEELKNLKLFGNFTSVCNSIASAWILVIMLIMMTDILGRILFNHPLAGTPEIAAGSLTAITFLQIAHVLRTGRHIRTTIVQDKAGPRVKLFLNLLTNVLGLFLFSLALISLYTMMVDSWLIREFDEVGTIHIPTYPVKTIVFGGCVMMVIQYLQNIYQNILFVVRGK